MVLWKQYRSVKLKLLEEIYLETIELKIGRYIYEINENDLIFDNGSCLQLWTKDVPGTSFNNAYNKGQKPLLSKKLASDLKKTNFIYLYKKINSTDSYWKFDIDRMKKMGY